MDSSASLFGSMFLNRGESVISTSISTLRVSSPSESTDIDKSEIARLGILDVIFLLAASSAISHILSICSWEREDIRSSPKNFTVR